MRKNGLRPRAVGALSVVALSLFLLLCLFNYGQEGVAEAVDPAWHLAIPGWFVDVFGVGAYAMVLLPLTWGVVVYFREDTPSLTMRAVGTLLLACSSAMICGLLQAPEPGLWAGAIGSMTVGLIGWFSELLGSSYGGPVAEAAAWLTAVVGFVVSLIWATDWMFHTLRRGPVELPSHTRTYIATEPTDVALRDADDDEITERAFVATTSLAEEAARRLATEAADPSQPVPVPEIPAGFSARRDEGRVVLRGPVGYEGVEFLSSTAELAEPERPEQRVVAESSPVAIPGVFEDEVFDVVREEPPLEDLATEELAPEESVIAETVETPAATEIPHRSLVILADGPVAERVDIAADETTAAIDLDNAAPESEQIERPRSGIGLPADSAFVDEFFAVETFVADVVAQVDDPTVGGDGASSSDDVARAYGAAPTTPVETPESPDMPVFAAAAPRPADEPAPTAESMIIDEVMVAPPSFTLIDDEIPGPIAERAAPRPPQSAPEPEQATTGPDLTRLSDIYLDPLFHDAVDAVLEAGRSSPMLLQRQFGVGHQRGRRLLEQMETAGMVGPEDETGGREIHLTAAAWEEFSASRSS